MNSRAMRLIELCDTDTINLHCKITKSGFFFASFCNQQLCISVINSM